MSNKNVLEHLENNLTFCLAVLGTYLAFCFQGFTKGFFLAFNKIIYINLTEGTFFFLDLITRQAKKSFDDTKNLNFFFENLWHDLILLLIAIIIHMISYQIKQKHLIRNKEVLIKYLSSLLSFFSKYGIRATLLIIIPHFFYIIFLPEPTLFGIIFMPYWAIVIPIIIYKTAQSDFFLKFYSLLVLMLFLILTPAISTKLGYSFAQNTLKKDFEIFDMFSLNHEGENTVTTQGRILLVKENSIYYYDYSKKIVTTLENANEKMDYISPMAN